ncbi:MAG: hypothetical protein IIB00_07845, partial [candidate division Zixibacteria bacterium]|nr:hypothetical protein [candidate division Zixibacteria bacterium]
IRSAVVGEWEPPKCNPGAFNLNVSQPQLSVCNSNLYLTYSEFANPLKGHGDDCHIRASYAPTGAANGDLLLTVSSNYGFSWDPGRDLTASYTPNCDTVPGGEYPDCQSDTWHSATRYGIDITGDIFGMTDVSANLGGYAGSDYLFVQYVNDREPGAAILNEGAWTLSAVRTFRFGCVDWEEESFPIFSLTGIDDPAHALPEQFVDTVLEIENVGNIDLNYTYVVEVTDGPAGNVTVDGTSSGGGTISAGIINKATHTIRLNATQSSEIQNAGARIIFAGDFLTAPDTIFINYCICDIQELVFDTLFDDLTLNRSATSASGLVFGNNGNLGAQDGRALGANSPGGFNFDFTHDPACECDLRSGTGTPQRSAKSYLFDASPIIRYKGGQIVTSMFSFGTIGEHQFRPLEEPYTEIAAPDPLYNHGYSGEFTTQDSVLGLAVDYYLPVDPLPGCWQMAYVRVCYYNNSDSTINDVTLAYGLDWDVPSDSTSPKWVDNVNNFEAGPERSAIWQGGVDYPPSNPAEVDSAWNCLPNSQRWAATSFVVPDTAEYPPFVTGGNAGDKSMGITLPKALYTRENARYVTTEWNLQALDTALDSIFGFSNYQTTQPESTYTDLHTVLNGGEYTLDPSDTAYLWMLLVSCIAVDETAFLEGLDSARARPIPDVIPSQSCCVLRGDTNGDGVVNISDAICVIRYAFCPQGFGCCDFSCLEQADADGGGDVNIGDCIFLVKYIFVAGAPAPPPCP